MTLRIGLTGNIACGKSTIGRLLVARGAEYVDADRLVGTLMVPGRPEYNRIVARFGPDIVTADGTINRPALGAIVFAEPAALRDLEAILHPGVRAEIRRRLAATTAPIIVIDAIKLLESGIAAELDAVWVVTCPRAEQIRRLTTDRGLTEEQAVLRIDAQSPQEEKARQATTVIHNNGTRESTEQQVDAALASLMAR